MRALDDRRGDRGAIEDGSPEMAARGRGVPLGGALPKLGTAVLWRLCKAVESRIGGPKKSATEGE